MRCRKHKSEWHNKNENITKRGREQERGDEGYKGEEGEEGDLFYRMHYSIANESMIEKSNNTYLDDCRSIVETNALAP